MYTDKQAGQLLVCQAGQPILHSTVNRQTVQFRQKSSDWQLRKNGFHRHSFLMLVKMQMMQFTKLKHKCTTEAATVLATLPTSTNLILSSTWMLKFADLKTFELSPLADGLRNTETTIRNCGHYCWLATHYDKISSLAWIWGALWDDEITYQHWRFIQGHDMYNCVLPAYCCQRQQCWWQSSVGNRWLYANDDNHCHNNADSNLCNTDGVLCCSAWDIGHAERLYHVITSASIITSPSSFHHHSLTQCLSMLYNSDY